jgi:hypothetical protein
MKRMLVFISLFFLGVSCSKNINWVSNTYQNSYQNSFNNAGFASIQMQIVEVKDEKTINNEIFKEVKEIANFVENNTNKIHSYKEITDSFIQTFKQSKKNNQTYQKWQYNLETKVEYETEDYLNISIHYNANYNKNNSYGEKKSLVFDKITGEKLGNSQIFTNLKMLTNMAEKKFRSKYALTFKNLNTNGFCFPNNTFYLSNNIVMDIEGITFFYNANEITEKSTKHYEVYFTYAELKPFLKF